jgi:hypothetical protein
VRKRTREIVEHGIDRKRRIEHPRHALGLLQAVMVNEMNRASRLAKRRRIGEI